MRVGRRNALPARGGLAMRAVSRLRSTPDRLLACRWPFRGLVSDERAITFTAPQRRPCPDALAVGRCKTPQRASVSGAIETIGQGAREPGPRPCSCALTCCRDRGPLRSDFHPSARSSRRAAGIGIETRFIVEVTGRSTAGPTAATKTKPPRGASKGLGTQTSLSGFVLLARQR